VKKLEIQEILVMNMLTRSLKRFFNPMHYTGKYISNYAICSMTSDKNGKGAREEIEANPIGCTGDDR